MAVELGANKKMKVEFQNFNKLPLYCVLHYSHLESNMYKNKLYCVATSLLSQHWSERMAENSHDYPCDIQKSYIVL